VERVGEWAPVPSKDRQLVDGERRLAAPGLGGPAVSADDVAEVDVHVTGDGGIAHELDPRRAVDEVEEHELPHLPTGHDAAGDAACPVELPAGLQLLGRGPYLGDRVSIREPLRRRHAGQPIRLSARARRG
jgi:hypothetical protein